MAFNMFSFYIAPRFHECPRMLRRWWSNSHMVRFLTYKMKSTSKLTKVYTKSKSERKKHKGLHELTTKIRVGKRKKKNIQQSFGIGCSWVIKCLCNDYVKV
jgi:hypothetical protein